jgi:exodeoxyribonuclease VII large subunit
MRQVGREYTFFNSNLTVMMDEKNYLTVSELNGFIQQVVQAGFPQAVWVCGEIQGYDRSRTKKHVFFDLCEKDAETHDVVAKIGLVIFSGKKSFLDSVLAESGNPFVLKDDIEVKFLCRVDFYPPHGAMRLVVESIDPSYTLGKIAAEKQRLIALLKKNGTLDKNKQLVLSQIPLRIGLITSYDSAAYNDFLAELHASGFGFQIVYRNTLMQGKGSPDDICSALGEMYAHAEFFDAIVITRGGGSIADLSCFDSQRIAEMIALSPVPVVSGIGHEIDLTITDLAAYVYHKTPTAVAKFFVSCVQDSLDLLANTAKDVFTASEHYVTEERNGLQQMVLTFQQSVRAFLKIHDRRIVQMEQIIQRDPLRLIESSMREWGLRKEMFLSALKGFFKDEGRKIQQYHRLIEASQPENICRRGFSITRTAEGVLVRSEADVQQGQTITTQLAEGYLESTIDRLSQGGK